MLRLIYCALTLGVLSMAGCRSGRPVVGTSDACAAVPVIPVAPDSDMLSAAIADTENEVCLADSGDPGRTQVHFKRTGRRYENCQDDSRETEYLRRKRGNGSR